MKCNKCNKKTDLFFCPECGDIIEFPDFIKGNMKLQNELSAYVSQLVNDSHKKKIAIAELSKKEILAETAYRDYHDFIAWLNETIKKESVKKNFNTNGNALNDEMTDFGRKCIKNECQIAVVGTVKAGKSMFINAILNEEIASSYPTPETASLTKFRYSPNGNFVKISFFTDDEWKTLWNDVLESSKYTMRDEDDNDDFLSTYKELNAEDLRNEMINKDELIIYPESLLELKKIVAKYTSAKYPEHFFAKEVEVGLSNFEVPKNVIFVDTPGLNDPVRYRSEISRRYINSASIVLLCISADKSAIDATELEQTSTIFSALKYAKDRIYVFGTKVDMPDFWQEVWKNNTKPQFVSDLSKKFLFGSTDKAIERIFPVTAWYYNLIQRAKYNKSLWDKESKYRTPLTNIVNECLGVCEPDDMAPGETYKSPRQRFYEQVEELETITNVPNIVAMLENGPIKGSEDIVLEDLQEMYVNLINKTSEIAQRRNKDILKDIDLSNSDDVHKKIQEIKQKIQEEEQNNPIKIKGIKDILQKLAVITNDIVKSIN